MKTCILSIAPLLLAALCTTVTAADRSFSDADEIRSAGLFDSYPASRDYTSQRPLFERPAYTSYGPMNAPCALDNRYDAAAYGAVNYDTNRCPGGVCPNGRQTGPGNYGRGARPLSGSLYRNTLYPNGQSAYGTAPLFAPAATSGSLCVGGQCSHGDHRACRDGSCGTCVNGQCSRTGYGSYGPTGYRAPTGYSTLPGYGNAACPNGNCNLRGYRPQARPIPATLAPIGFGLFGRL